MKNNSSVRVMRERRLGLKDLRALIICGITFAVIMSVCVLSISTIRASANEMAQRVQVIMENVDNDEWESAERSAAELNSAWKGHKKVWSALMDHKRATIIGDQIVKIREHIKTRNKDMAKCELSILIEALTHYPHEELPLLENIL